MCLCLSNGFAYRGFTYQDMTVYKFWIDALNLCVMGDATVDPFRKYIWNCRIKFVIIQTSQMF